MQLPQITEYRGIRVLTTSQIAEMYKTDSKTISYNFSYNKKKYAEGKHYIKLEGAELRTFKASREIPDCHKYSAHLYLWTEKGTLLHAKSLNTDKAWEVYDYLVDYYFRAQEKQPEPVKKEPLPPNPMMRTVVDIPENPEAQETIREIKKALAAVEVMLDESDRYVSKEAYCRYQDGISDALQALMIRVQRYLSISPRLIEKIF
jgi:hypothetical protein